MSEFHFIRPQWLIAILAAVLCFLMLLKQKLQNGNWKQVIDKDLLPHLLESGVEKQSKGFWIAILITWIIACFALAGPTWEKLPQPVIKKQDALVIVLDMSLSMFAEDQKPSRLVRAKHKVQDILNNRKEGLTALIVYSGDTHVVTPLTEDSHTIASLVPALNPAIMPSYGSRVDLALKQANEFLKQTNGKGRILLITDGIEDTQLDSVKNALGNTNLSILAVGTQEGSPIPLPDQGLLKSDGQIVISKLKMQPLNTLQSAGALLQPIHLDDRDIKALLPASVNMQNKLSERTLERWNDMGYWLVIFLLPVCLLAFRQGQLAVLFLVITLPLESKADWQDLWKNNDQQAAEKFSQSPAEAAALFDNPNWQGASHYQAGNYEQALEAYKRSESQERHYNQGNTLAKLGQLEDAIKAYDEALKVDPANKDAQENKKQVEQLLEQQKQQEQKGDQENKDDQQDKQDGEKQDGQQQEKDGQGSSKQDNQNNDDQQGEQQQNQDSESQQSQQSGDQEQKQDINKALQEQKESAEKQEPSAQQTSEQKQEESENQQAKEQATQNKEEGQQLTEQQSETPKPKGVNPALEKLTEEQRQSMQQWLRRVPDDPSGLLRRKFEYQHRLKQQQQQTQSKEGPLW